MTASPGPAAAARARRSTVTRPGSSSREDKEDTISRISYHLISPSSGRKGRKMGAANPDAFCTVHGPFGEELLFGVC